jgi:preprotein translocase subunit SecA
MAILSSSKSNKGKVAQIRTGEGKSTIIAILACYLGLLGDFVDVITSSHYLAIRDLNKYMVLYDCLGLSNSHICYNHLKKEAFRGQILYGTNTDFEFSMMRDDLYGL